MVQRSLNSKRNLFNTVVYILLPASLVFAFIYSILLTRERKVDYLLFITFVTVSYTLVVMLVDLLQTDSDSVGIKYLINKLNLNDDIDVDIAISIDNQKNMCDLSFNYPDRQSPEKGLSEINIKSEKVINGDKKVSDSDINNKQDKDFYNRCDSLENEEKLSENIGQCIGYDTFSTTECRNRILQSGDTDTALYDCTKPYIPKNIAESGVAYTVVFFISGICAVAAEKTETPWINLLFPVILIVMGTAEYIFSSECYYVDIENSDISVSPFSKRFIYYWMMYLLPQIMAGLWNIQNNSGYTVSIILIVMLSSIYVINDYSFLSVLESNYASFGKFINIMKLDRKSDRINYNLSFKERDTNKTCVIDGIWDKTAQSPEIIGDMNGCNSDNLGKNLGLMM